MATEVITKNFSIIHVGRKNNMFPDIYYNGMETQFSLSCELMKIKG